jgi:hypothetical protein
MMVGGGMVQSVQSATKASTTIKRWDVSSIHRPRGYAAGIGWVLIGS